MLYISVALIAGVLIGYITATIVSKKSTKNQILAVENKLKQKISDSESASKSAHLELEKVKTQAEEQKQITIQKIGEAFHAGSNMMEEMGTGLSQIQELVNNTSEPIQNIFDSGNKAQNMINNSRTSMEKMAGSLTELNDISGLIGELCDHMNQVNEKTVVIHNIANQANLLSLNAAIEAARAGEAGRGFSVVANDMNRLSDLSATAAQEISQILSSGLKNIDKITADMDSKITTFTDVSNNVLGCFENMGGAVKSISSLTESLSTDSHHTVEGVKKVSETTQTTMESLTKMLSDVTGIISGNIITDISPKEAHKHLSEYTIIDVRNPNEWNDDLTHIEQATLYCLKDNFKEAIAHMDKNKKYLFVCRSGGRSARGARIAQALGFKDVYNLSGGMLKWRESFPI